MENLQQVFVSEALQLINDLERSLLCFERDTNDLRSVQEIFRVMHTLKGSASMFGFEALSSITHDIETIYDEIRNERLRPGPEVLAITLEVVDHLKDLIADRNLLVEATKQTHESLVRRIQLLVLSIVNNESADVEISGGVHTFYIYYKPDLNTFKNGTNPLFIIDDLYALGKCRVFPHFDDVPSFACLSDQCYAGFEILLTTTSDIMAIKEVFIFVETDSEVVIEKIADRDLLASDAYLNAFSSKTMSHQFLGIDGFKSAAERMRAPLASEPRITNSAAAKVDGSSIRVDSGKLDELMNLISELVTSQARLSMISGQQTSSELALVSETIEKITRRLRDNAFNICLVPIDTLAVRFQRLVRDVSKEVHKEINFTTEGLDTEIDRSVIEKVTDPILHILRNCIDHGIETPDERLSRGKTAEGRIHFKAFHLGTHVHVEISDDGRGIDVEMVRQKAITKGLISSQDQLSDEELHKLIFTPGFSTVERVTDLSGRGVGMDIVRRNIESIHGEVSIRSTPGEGTTISIRLPLTLSIMDGMLVELGGDRYLIPLTVIDKCYEMNSSLISTDVKQKFVFDDMLLPVLNLHQIFQKEIPRSKILQVIKVKFDFPVGITVDSVIGEYQAVMKPLGGMYHHLDEFSGATILGDGSVALVLDTTKLIRQLLMNPN